MRSLVDTNVLSELRKRDRCDANVARWFESCPAGDIYISVLTIGEIRRGVERLRRRDGEAAAALDGWLRRLLAEHGDRVLPVSPEVAEEWGRLNVPDPLPVIDGLLAATAKVCDLTLVTRNVKDVERTGVRCLNPFAAERA